MSLRGYKMTIYMDNGPFLVVPKMMLKNYFVSLALKFRKYYSLLSTFQVFFWLNWLINENFY